MMPPPPTIVQESLEYEPQANGLAERIIQTAKGMLVPAGSALGHRVGGKIPGDHALTWLARHAASVHDRYHAMTDDGAPWQRVAG